MLKSSPSFLRPEVGEPPLAYAKRLLSSMAEQGLLDRTEMALSQEERIQAARLLNRDEKLPAPLRKKVIALLYQKKRGPNRMSLLNRNGAIASMVAWIIQDYGLAGTRNEATEADSAAFIVSQALRELGEEISEAQVNRIYLEFNPWVRSAMKEVSPSA
jgi:hypothetical protein